MVALPSDVARSSANAKRAYRAAFEGMIDVLGQSHAHGRDRSRALAIAALWLRGMVIARASDDRRLADELRKLPWKSRWNWAAGRNPNMGCDEDARRCSGGIGHAADPNLRIGGER